MSSTTAWALRPENRRRDGNPCAWHSGSGASPRSEAFAEDLAEPPVPAHTPQRSGTIAAPWWKKVWFDVASIRADRLGVPAVADAGGLGGRAA